MRFGQNNCCQRLWKVAKSPINRPIWSHCFHPSLYESMLIILSNCLCSQLRDSLHWISLLELFVPPFFLPPSTEIFSLFRFISFFSILYYLLRVAESKQASEQLPFIPFTPIALLISHSSCLSFSLSLSLFLSFFLSLSLSLSLSLFLFSFTC